MGFLDFSIFFLILFIIYLIYLSQFIQIFIHKLINKKFVLYFQNKVKGNYLKKGFFAVSHEIITLKKFNSFSNSNKLNYNFCYNIVKFKTKDTNWELFYHLIKEDGFFSEILNIRVFPNSNFIKSEGNIEKSYSRLNIFTNNYYLSKILESSKIKNDFNWLIQNTGDSIHLNRNSIHLKIFLKNKEKLNTDEILDIIKTLNQIKDNVYKKGILEY